MRRRQDAEVRFLNIEDHNAVSRLAGIDMDLKAVSITPF